MKSKRRHELQHNVLDAELGKVIAFIKRRGTHLAGGLLIVAVVVFVVVSLARSKRGDDEQRQTQFHQALEMGPGNRLDEKRRLEIFKSLTLQTSDKKLASLACVAAGDVYATMLAVGRMQMSDAEAREHADQAAEWYNKVIAEFGDHPVAVAKAHFGLAKLAENRGDLDAAREEYETIGLMEAPLAGQPLQLFARAGLNSIDDLAELVRMASTAPADPNAATQPADANAPVDPNVPPDPSVPAAPATDSPQSQPASAPGP